MACCFDKKFQRKKGHVVFIDASKRRRFKKDKKLSLAK